VKSPTVQVQLLVWIFVMRIMMVVSSGARYFHQRSASPKPATGNADKMNFEQPLTFWSGSPLVSIALADLTSSRTS
jgi:K(+)-stimulated pyrophosphate-energized sodium pump